MKSARDLLIGSPYEAYLYAYPHKTSYRPLNPGRPLETVWEHEDRTSLFLYLHVPFCEMRCGFCNLFTEARPREASVEDYLDALQRQALETQARIGTAQFARFAIGGGTPTYLTASQLHRIFALVTETFDLDPGAIPIAIESSPETITNERLDVLERFRLDRISIGVQSFTDDEVRKAARPQSRRVVLHALELIRARQFPVLNIDLMYGLAGQTERSLEASIDEALRFRPEELYLYPLYIRPLTGLGNRKNLALVDRRLALYRHARAYLDDLGYRQHSMRSFRRKTSREIVGPIYRCQEDGMIGLGAGARSYTTSLHYSTEYAVGRRGVKAIIEDYCQRDSLDFGAAEYGFVLDLDEQKRRFVILSLLEGALRHSDYRARFATDARTDFPELIDLASAGLADEADSEIRLTALGIERSDRIGPWLHSQRVNQLMKEYELT